MDATLDARELADSFLADFDAMDKNRSLADAFLELDELEAGRHLMDETVAEGLADEGRDLQHMTPVKEAKASRGGFTTVTEEAMKRNFEAVEVSPI